MDSKRLPEKDENGSIPTWWPVLRRTSLIATTLTVTHLPNVHVSKTISSLMTISSLISSCIFSGVRDLGFAQIERKTKLTTTCGQFPRRSFA